MEKRALVLKRLLWYELIEVLDSFGDDIYQRDGEEERSCEGHGEVHDSFGLEALQAWDEVAEDGDLEEECHHEHEFQDEGGFHYYLNLYYFIYNQP